MLTIVSIIAIHVSAAAKQFFPFGDALGIILAIGLHIGAGNIFCLLRDCTQPNAEHTPSRR